MNRYVLYCFVGKRHEKKHCDSVYGNDEICKIVENVDIIDVVGKLELRAIVP